MSAEKNELLDYIDDKLSADFTEKAVLKQTEFGKVALYRQKCFYTPLHKDALFAGE